MARLDGIDQGIRRVNVKTVENKDSRTAIVINSARESL